MKCFINFSLSGFSNSYLIGPENGGEAIVVDPGEMNIELLNLIEKNNYYVRHILVTHNHRPHIEGIRTMLKIYDARIYSALDQVMQYPSQIVKPLQKLNLSGMDVEVLEFEGHSTDSLVYKIAGMLFTGDTLGAGNLGHQEGLESLDDIRKSIYSKINKMRDSTMVFPGHGPPSTLRIEKEFNPELKMSEST